MKGRIRFLLIVCLLLSFVGFIIHGEVVEAYMIVTNPAEDMNSEINIAWHSPIEGTKVEYTVATDATFANAQSIDGTCKAYTFDPETGTKYNYNQCGVTLTNLQSNTQYIYRVGKTTFSEPYHFKTGGGTSFSFVHVTDIHAYTPIPGRVAAANSILDKASESNVAFSVITGDEVAYGSYYDQWQLLYGMNAAKKMPLVMTPGNHTYYCNVSGVGLSTKDNRYFNAVTNNPTNGALDVANSTYFFKYNNALFISIDSEAASASSELLTNQQNWFKEVVMNNPAKFIIVYCHRPFYTGNSENASQATTMRQSWQSIFDETGVDLVLSGHNHSYSRTYQVYNNSKISNSGTGTVYVDGIQLGDRYATVIGEPMPMVAKAYVGVIQDNAVKGGINGGTIFTVSSNTISGKFINDSGEVLDEFIIYSKEPAANFYDTFESSYNVERLNRDQATLHFNDTGFAKIKSIKVTDNYDNVLGELNYPNNMTSLPISIMNINDANYQINIETTTYRGSSIYQTSISNAIYNYGTISNLKAEKHQLSWTAQLQNNIVQKYEIYVDGSLYQTLNNAYTAIPISDLDVYELHTIKLVALNANNDIIYQEEISYGIDGFFNSIVNNITNNVTKILNELKGSN